MNSQAVDAVFVDAAFPLQQLLPLAQAIRQLASSTSPTVPPHSSWQNISMMLVQILHCPGDNASKLAMAAASKQRTHLNKSHAAKKQLPQVIKHNSYTVTWMCKQCRGFITLANEQTLSTINTPDQSYLLCTCPTVALHPTKTNTTNTAAATENFQTCRTGQKMKQPTTSRHLICTVTCKPACVPAVQSTKGSATAETHVQTAPQYHLLLIWLFPLPSIDACKQ
jgi:hypothetical protein